MDRFNPGEWLDDAFAWLDRHQLTLAICAALLVSIFILSL